MSEQAATRSFRLCFFTPTYREADNVTILDYLSKIETTCPEIDVITIDAVGRETQEGLFEEYFGNPKTSQLVRRRVGRAPRHLFRTIPSSSAVYLRGVVALVEGGIVQWANKPPDSFPLLEDIAARGIQAIDDLYTFSDTLHDEEVDLLDAFEASQYCAGKLERNFWLPSSPGPAFENSTSKYVDAILRKPNGECVVIEAEMTLNYTAIGQALCYQEWFRSYEGLANTTPAIICASSKPEFINTCKALGITVYNVTGEGVTLDA